MTTEIRKKTRTRNRTRWPRVWARTASCLRPGTRARPGVGGGQVRLHPRRAQRLAGKGREGIPRPGQGQSRPRQLRDLRCGDPGTLRSRDICRPRWLQDRDAVTVFVTGDVQGGPLGEPLQKSAEAGVVASHDDSPHLRSSRRAIAWANSSGLPLRSNRCQPHRRDRGRWRARASWAQRPRRPHTSASGSERPCDAGSRQPRSLARAD